MAGGVVTVASGVMSPLIFKLITLMGDEYLKFKGVRKQASFLEKELSAMNAALQKLELMDGELDPTIKVWRDDVRDMSYDMENCIDDFIRKSQADDAKAGFIKKAIRPIKKLRWRLRIAHRMEELKTLAIEANSRRERYKIDDWKPTSGPMVVDPRLQAVYQEAATLVGIDGPREEVATLLKDTRRNLRVVSVVGFGGLGKTTLSKQVYDEIGPQFNCKAFFSVSQRPDMTELLKNLQFKLRMKELESSRARKVEDIIEELRDHLKEKRYLIVVDDLWDQSAWNTIKCVFPEGSNGSRVIVTTRVEFVASSACENDREGIYRLKPLNEENSRILLLSRVFGTGDGCPVQLKEVMAEILKKCHGLPLAVITIASLLASEERSRKAWESIRDSLGAHFATNPTLEGMKSILNLSYMHLPARLRACFLHLGMYPEDCEILRDDLVRQWIAEGLLVSNLHVPDLEDVGKSYFNELVNKSMIQPSTIEYGEVLSCRVHDMMLDLILSKCDEDNFISVAHNYEDMARLHGSKYKVRRLSLRSMVGGGEIYGTYNIVSLSQVRSFTLLGNCMPPLLFFKYLRVLRIDQHREDVEILDLNAMSQLFQLKYLYVSRRGFVQLPAKLQGLVYLETLDLGDARLKSIPSDIAHLSRLSYLDIRMEEMLPEWIGNMKSLRNLRILRLPYMTTKQREVNVMKGIMSLGKLIKLRELKIQLDFLEKKELDALACSIGKLHMLKDLQISGIRTEADDLLGSLSNPFPHIEQFHGSGWTFRRVPIWMGGGLHRLRILNLCVEETSTEEVHLLGELPSLVVFHFSPSQIPQERSMLGTGLFPLLEVFTFWSADDVSAYLGFEAGAMPNLRTLVLCIDEWGGSTPVGMEHLLRLQKIQLPGDYSDDADIVCAFRNTLSGHPNRPSVE